jgi:chromosome partitioning protein
MRQTDSGILRNDLGVRGRRTSGDVSSRADMASVPRPRNDSARRQRANQAERAGQPFWIVVASGKGGSGKTTCSFNLATQALQDGVRVLLVDLDSQRTLTRWHNARPPEASDVALLTYRLRDVMVDDIERIDHKAAANAASLVILDTPPGLDDWPQQTRLLLGRSDFVLIPTSQGGPDVDSVIEWMAVLRREGIRAAFVLNRTDRKHLSFEAAKLRLNRVGMLAPCDIRRLTDIENTYSWGVGICEVKGARGADEVASVWHFVRNAIEF